MVSSPVLSIGIVTVADLPEGCGRTARLRTLAGALVGMGHRVRIWNQHGLEASGAEQVSGEMAGARYEYVLGTTARQRGFRVARHKIKAVKIIFDKVRAAALTGELDVLIFNNLAFYDTFPITRLAMRLGIPTVQCYEDERYEIIAWKQLGWARRMFGWNSWAADRWCSPLATQIWVISSYLRAKYERLARHADRVRVVPTIINCKAWSMPPEPNHEVPLILYSGGFGEQDDMEKLFRALSYLKQQKIRFKMRFLGARPDLPRVQQSRCLASALGLEDSSEYLGFCLADVVKREVGNANILVNLRTNSLWGQSGLSTKLSEY